MLTQKVGTAKVTARVPKLNLRKYVNESALYSVAGKPSVYACHTNGTTCDTTSGCSC